MITDTVKYLTKPSMFLKPKKKNPKQPRDQKEIP